ncbi:MAG: sigma-70 family RNA polymerase sigma factor [Gemmatimonadales bacterium]|nr:sigma-70 family RNA polymerase sigma factor [Gemmatimonadales bacterium]
MTPPPEGPLGDPAELIRAVSAGSNDALGALYQRYSGKVFAIAYHIVGSRAEAEDILQDVFVGLPRLLRRYEDRGRFDSWLARVVSRTALMGLRRAKPTLSLPVADIAARTEPVLERLAVGEALAALPLLLRQVFLLHEVEGYDHDEIAEMLGIRVGTSYVRLHRAWHHLRRALRVE